MLLPDLLWRLCLVGLATARPGSYPSTSTQTAERAAVPEVLLDQFPPVNTTLIPDPLDLSSSELPQVLRPRAPAKKEADPIGITTRFNKYKLQGLIQKEQKKKKFTETFVQPTKTQLRNWNVELELPEPLENGEKTFLASIGVTSKYTKWPKSKTFYRFGQLTGCTGVFVFSKKGFWASHHWERVKDERKEYGMASFQMRFPPTNEILDTPEPYFKKMNCDILTEVTPPGQKNNRKFRSLKDVELEEGRPFEDTEDVDVHIMTKAESVTSKTPKYANNVKQLEDTVREAIKPNRYSLSTYVGGVPKDNPSPGQLDDLRGYAWIMYSPLERVEKQKDGCEKYWARAMLFVEDDPEPKIDLTWQTN